MVKLGETCKGTFVLSQVVTRRFCFQGQKLKTRILSRTGSSVCEVGGVLCVPGRGECGERSGACGLPGSQETDSGRPFLSLCCWLLGQPLSYPWADSLWSPDLPMGDARHGVDSSTETPERGGAPRLCQGKKKSKLIQQCNEFI